MNLMLLYIGLSVLCQVERPYEIDHFVYHHNAAIRPLPFESKVFAYVPGNGSLKRFIDKEKPMNVTIERMSNPPGVIFNCDDRRQALDLIANLAAKSIKSVPIVRIDGVELMPSGTILVKPKPFVTSNMLLQRVNQIAKANKVEIGRIDDSTYEITFESLSFPSNVFILANLLANDKVWIDNAVPYLIKVHDDITGKLSIESDAIDNLGYYRTLKLVVTVNVPKVKVRTDLIPPLSSLPRLESVWYDIGPTIVSKNVGKYAYGVDSSFYKEVITVTWKVRYCYAGFVNIEAISVPYEYDGKQLIAKINGLLFKQNSVIDDSDITDIRPVPEYQVMPKLPELGEYPVSKPFEWTKLGVIFLIAGCSLILIRWILCFISSFNSVVKSKTELEQLLGCLEHAVDALGSNSGRADYFAINWYLSAIMKIENKISNDLSLALAELDNLYKKDGVVNQAALKAYLKAYIASLNVI